MVVGLGVGGGRIADVGGVGIGLGKAEVETEIEAVEAGVLAGRLAVRVPDRTGGPDGPAPTETVGALAGSTRSLVGVAVQTPPV